MLLNKDFTPQEIVEKLGVKPCRLKQMLESKRLAERLELVEKIAAVRADHAILVAVEAAADRLAALAANDTETGRKACLDVLAQAREARTERKSARSGSVLANWQKSFRGWRREEQRRTERQAAEAKEGPPDEWREAAPHAEAAAPDGAVARNRAPYGAGVPRQEETAAPRATAKGQAALDARPPRRMSKSKRRELAGLPPEKTKRGPVTVAPPPGYGLDQPFVPRPGGQVVRHLICGKVFLGST